MSNIEYIVTITVRFEPNCFVEPSELNISSHKCTNLVEGMTDIMRTLNIKNSIKPERYSYNEEIDECFKIKDFLEKYFEKHLHANWCYVVFDFESIS